MTRGCPYTAPSRAVRQATDRCPAAGRPVATPLFATMPPNCPHAATGNAGPAPPPPVAPVPPEADELAGMVRAEGAGPFDCPPAPAELHAASPAIRAATAANRDIAWRVIAPTLVAPLPSGLAAHRTGLHHGMIWTDVPRPRQSAHLSQWVTASPKG